ncbi:TolC family protein [Aliarcobacter skirrowii]|uniref:RND family efflux system, outer membrane channel protein, TolC family n=1 Tax=Aliarcobacter skirrowii CCUG 10374 TaxID=1032239 RepID=A0AAD0SM06_9BACT|nr:TolC family protein [Aliarcobacter skirrowii]AXX85148.1 RND family efflux system, outer membrane channel protein, TolC family [Aliarcobacter skirrowii CCUG 10374]KAB0620695.1 TolC family protein [Aliarcobacter skirrowii CCUG 10374]RXI25958.1 transporter [Aliarcobacter skirrowii CCUG 10374]SUU96326.1 outer membrane channel protein [Aliarcobacter skirrowii]
MRKLFIFLLTFTYLFANEDGLKLLKDDKKEYRKLDKESILKKYDYSKNSWIGTINLDASVSTTHPFDKSKDDNYSKQASIGFTQSLFESGGIWSKIDNAKSTFDYDLLSWENENSELLLSIYSTLLEIKKLKYQQFQNRIKYENKDIELIIKKIQYEAGKSDIIELNNAVMSKNIAYRDVISVENSLKQKELELAKYTDLKYENIEILDFKPISKEDFLEKNFSLLKEDARVAILNSSYKIDRSKYLPKLTLNANARYSNTKDDFNNMLSDTRKEDSQSTASLNFSMPLFDYNMSSKLQESKIEVLKQQTYLNDLKSDMESDFEQILTKIDTYEKISKSIDDNIKLYEDLIKANRVSNQAGMIASYDLEILENSKKINEYDLLINDINILQEYSKLYFKIRG